MTTSLPPLAYPGLPLGPSTSYNPGPGTHLHPSSTNGPSQITASLAGRPILLPAPLTSGSKGTPKPLPTISIPRLLPSPSHVQVLSRNVGRTNTLPGVGEVVLAVVRRVRGRQVDVGIVVVYGGGGGGGAGVEMGMGEGSVCADEWPAILRKEDVRATEKEKVVCAEGFRVGDVVRGVVISLGDQSNYYLTTAKNELGVIMAKSEAGNTMYPISWREFKDPETGAVESRKVAKPF